MHILTPTTKCACKNLKFPFPFRKARDGLPRFGNGAIHQLLLRRTAVSRIFRGSGNQMPDMALLRHRRKADDFPLSERDPIQPTRIRLRLVVQRQMRFELKVCYVVYFG